MCPSLAGYWQTWNLPNEKTLPIQCVPQKYSDVIIAFVAPDEEGVLHFAGPNVPTRNDIRFLQRRGQKVLLSIGGGGVTVTLDTADKVMRFRDSLLQLIKDLKVDGIDIDVERGMPVSGSPLQPGGTALGLIEGLDQVLELLPSGFMLTMAPETINLVGGITDYGGDSGNYLPLILHFGNRITRVHMQYYNSGSMLGLDGQAYEAGTVDFAVAMTEAIIKGFPIADTGVYFEGLPSCKVSIGLPASPQAALNGYLTSSQIDEAFARLITGYRGNHKCAKPYPCLGGLMTWSVQWDSLRNFSFMHNGNNILQSLC